MAAKRARAVWMLLRTAANAEVRLCVAFSAGLGFVAAALSTITPLALKWLVDALASGAPKAAVPLLAISYVGLLGVSRGVSQLQSYAFAIGEQKLQSRLSSAAFRHLLGLPMRFHLDRQGGQLIELHSLVLHGARLLLTHATFTLLPAVAQILGIMLIVAGELGPAYWLVIAGATAGYALVFLFGVRGLAASSQVAVDAQVAAAGSFADAMTSIDAIKAVGGEGVFAKRYADRLTDNEHNWRRCAHQRLRTGFAAALVFTASLSLAAMLAIRSIGVGELSAGGFVLVAMYLMQIVQPLEMAGFAIRDVAQAATYVSAWSTIQAETAEVLAGARDKSNSRIGPPEIAFDQVSFSYEPGVPILESVSFTVPARSVVAIVGPSGAGKSSLLRLLLGHYTPTSGRVLVDNATPQSLGLRFLREQSSIVTQDIALFNDSLRENLAIANPKASEESLGQAISNARLETLLERLPEGLETRIGERGWKLSGGERQRLALARVMLRDTPLLLLDEATSALDPSTEQAVIADLLKACSGRTVMIVTHRLALAARADSIIVLDRGRVIQRGTHADLVASPGAYARMWRQQTAADEAAA